MEADSKLFYPFGVAVDGGSLYNVVVVDACRRLPAMVVVDEDIFW